ncbi:MAG: coiled-coil domain-containing protein [Patescibacteria group bacterium]
MTKAELQEFVQLMYKNGLEIEKLHKELIQGDGDNKSVLEEIKSKLEETNNLYNNLFAEDEGKKSKLSALNTEIKNIKDYHRKLIEGDDSIKAVIEESQKKITDFYSYLFDAEENNGESRDSKTIASIKKVNEFFSELTNPDDGIEAQITSAKKRIQDKVDELFTNPSEGQKSKIALLEERINEIDAYDEKIKSQITPQIQEKQQYLDDLKNDIDGKRKSINQLLQNVTGGALAEGYLQSMGIYSTENPRDYFKGSGIREKIWYFLPNCFILFHNIFLRQIKEVLRYLIFIVPLVLATFIIIAPEVIIQLLGIQNIPTKLTSSDFILYRFMVSFPLAWIGWFGQRNISMHKRLFEEYNHKLRVTQMFLLFSTEHKALSNNKISLELENALIDAIKSNPAEHMGKSITLIDSITARLFPQKFTETLENKIIEIVKDTIEKLKNDPK